MLELNMALEVILASVKLSAKLARHRGAFMCILMAPFVVLTRKCLLAAATVNLVYKDTGSSLLTILSI